MKRSILCNRDDFRTNFTEFLNEEGQLGYLTGGKSMGKSKALSVVENQITFKNHKIIIQMDGRKLATTNFLTALCDSVFEAYKTCTANGKIKEEFKYFLPVVALIGRYDKAAVNDVIDSERDSRTLQAIEDDFIKFKTFATGNPDKTVQALSALLTELGNCNISIVIDEANQFFQSALATPPPSEAVRQHAIDVLKLITLHTNQKNGINVLLVTSEFSFYYHLSELGFNVTDLKPHIIFGDIPPVHVYDY